MTTKNDSNLALALRLILVAVVMFAFAFALVPIYNTVCKWLGTNGEAVAADKQLVASFKVDASREVEVEFYSDVNSNLNWDFKAQTNRLTVNPGKQARVIYLVSNNSGHVSTGTAKFNIYPPEAGRYFKKTECFCFKQQTLAKKEQRQMPLVFAIDPRLPKRIKNIVLTYEFIRTEKPKAKQQLSGLIR